MHVVVATSFPGRFAWLGGGAGRGGKRVFVLHHEDLLLPPFLTRLIQSTHNMKRKQQGELTERETSEILEFITWSIEI